MGTRSLVHFVEDDEIICTVYRQFDGYYDGRGRELADWLSGMKVVNGYGLDDTADVAGNGMGCLAAQWIRREKGDQIGNIYVQKAGEAEPDDIFIEYEYFVSVDKKLNQPKDSFIEQPGEIRLKARRGGGKPFDFDDHPRFFDEFLASQNEVA